MFKSIEKSSQSIYNIFSFNYFLGKILNINKYIYIFYLLVEYRKYIYNLNTIIFLIKNINGYYMIKL